MGKIEVNGGGGGGRLWDSLESKCEALRSALKSEISDSEMRKILADYLALYASSITADHKTADEALTVISGCRYTPLEATFAWLGRWRPCSAIHLVLTVMNATNDQIMTALSGISGLSAPNLALSEKQLVELNNLRKIINGEELHISNQHARFQAAGISCLRQHLHGLEDGDRPQISI